MHEKSAILTEEEIEEAIRSSIDFDYILKRTFDLFSINYHDVDCDSQLVFNKMSYVFIDMPPVNEAEEQE